MKKVLCILLVAAVLLTAAGCSRAEQLEKAAVKKAESMLAALEDSDFETLKSNLHPVTGKDAQTVAEDLQALVDAIGGKPIEDFQTGEVTAIERARNDWSVRGTGSITLEDGSVYRVVFRFLSDGSEGFTTFMVQGYGVAF